MKWNNNKHLEGRHAMFSPSSPSWLNYDETKLINAVHSLKAKELGTRLHAYAEEAIKLGIRQEETSKTLNMYINDAIGYGMDVEKILYFSDNFFGTADAICFYNNLLRIHDYKSGKGPTKMEQLMGYAALFCLEYNVLPKNIDIELRIYQNDDIQIYIPTPSEISNIMRIIKKHDKTIRNMYARD